MDDPVKAELELVAALKLTAAPPEAWVEAAALIPTMVGELATIEALIARPEFRERFALQPQDALTAEGLPATPTMVAAIRDRLAE